jgi:hypothetical protein
MLAPAAYIVYRMLDCELWIAAATGVGSSLSLIRAVICTITTYQEMWQRHIHTLTSLNWFRPASPPSTLCTDQISETRPCPAPSSYNLYTISLPSHRLLPKRGTHSVQPASPSSHIDSLDCSFCLGIRCMCQIARVKGILDVNLADF